MCIDTEDGDHSFAVIKFNDFIALELDRYDYIGQTQEPILIDKKSFRITSDLLDFELPSDFGVYSTLLPRVDIKFVDYRRHLVILDWNDFIAIANNE